MTTPLLRHAGLDPASTISPITKIAGFQLESQNDGLPSIPSVGLKPDLQERKGISGIDNPA